MVQLVLVGIALLGALTLIGWGVLAEARSRPADSSPELPQETPPANPSFQWGRRWRWAMRRHPAPLVGWLETGLWLLLLWSLFDHVASPQGSLTGRLIWLLTFFPHEAGHVLCAPFGRLLMFAGGSIWQVLIWFLPASYAYFIRRRLNFAMLFGVIAGHSFINMAVYIADARARQLTLTFGLVGKEGHDWWNILQTVNLLEYDQWLAWAAIGVAILVVSVSIGLGLAATWFLPQGIPFQGYPLPALGKAWQAAASDELPS